MATVQFENPAGDIVEEIAIMRHGDDGTGVLVEKALQPGDGFRVQMIGRFIEQQHVGLRQQQTAQGNSAPLTTR